MVMSGRDARGPNHEEEHEQWIYKLSDSGGGFPCERGSQHAAPRRDYSSLLQALLTLPRGELTLGGTVLAVLANSTFLNAFGDQLASYGQFTTLASSTSLSNTQAVLGPLLGVTSMAQAASNQYLTIGLTLNRANDPSALLAASWSARQAELADQSAVWAKYGADPAIYAAVTQALSSIVGADALAAASAAGYVSSAADRTIWMTLNPAQFSALFKTDLLNAGGQLVWGGNLDIPDSIAASVRGVWIENDAGIDNPPPLATQGVTLTAGPMGIGNATTSQVNATPNAVAAYYGFPLPPGTPTGAVALVENAVQSQSQLFAAYNDYRTAIGLQPVTASQFQAVTGPSTLTGNPNGELTLDISVVAGGAPRSTQLLYAFTNQGASLSSDSTPFKAYQQAFFDTVNDPGVLSSSWGIFSAPTAGSPFQTAFQDLFVDGTLSNVSVHVAAGDQGAAGYYGNGVPNVTDSQAAAYALAVGGTSLATLNSAQADPTLSTILALALSNDPTTLLQLTAAGLKTLPSLMPDVVANSPSSTLPAMIEAVWNTYVVTTRPDGSLEVSFSENEEGSGGVLTSLAVPSYQSKFGLTPTSVTGIGRGAPDVSALSYGDSTYAALNASFVTDPSASLLMFSGGTSAASPLWATLTANLNAVFADQGLPQLGFYNDLLYQAAALAPASFNDVQLGNNIDSYYLTTADTGYYNAGQDSYMVPTGLGYTATPGYDLATGLGSPNGLLLARALTAIVHAQDGPKVPTVFGDSNSFSGVSTVSQTLLVQDELGAGTTTLLGVGTGAPVVAVGGSPLAWTSRLAEQTLQKDFSSALVLQLDGAAQGTTYQVAFNAGQGIAAFTGTNPLPLYQAHYTNAFGIVQFGDASGDVTLARPVAVAQTALGASNQEAILRLRQVSSDDLKLEVYKVDDFNGTIGGIAPGQAGYAAAAASRDYVTDKGTTVISGPGFGNYGEARIKGVNAGDILAMHLINATTGGSFWAFASANEKADGSHVNHLWNYGLNTYGWEGSTGGGDRDYNDLVVGIDFTSGSGHQLIA